MIKIKRFINVVLCFSNWYIFLFDYFGLIHQKEILYKLRGGVKFIARPFTHDKFVISEVWTDHVYDPAGFEIKSTDTVVDVGAYIGDFTIFAARKARQGRVLAIEPFPDNYNLLQKNIRINNLRNVIAINKALSDENGTEKIYIAKINSGGHSTVKEYISGDSLEVRSVTLSRIITDYKVKKIDFLKMDCEGAEYKILFGTPKSILNKVDKIVMEYHTVGKDKNVEYLTKFLCRSGFEVKLSADNSPILYAYR